MRGVLVRAAVVVVAATSLIGVAAERALAAEPIPSNCTFSTPNNYTGVLSCTGMGPTTRWALLLHCMAWPPYKTQGNRVTGNGTSTATCFDGGFVNGASIIYY